MGVALASADAGDLPPEFTATTVKKYFVPLVRPLKLAEVPGPVSTAWLPSPPDVVPMNTW
jgi:hypothetical protein